MKAQHISGYDSPVSHRPIYSLGKEAGIFSGPLKVNNYLSKCYRPSPTLILVMVDVDWRTKNLTYFLFLDITRIKSVIPHVNVFTCLCLIDSSTNVLHQPHTFDGMRSPQQSAGAVCFQSR